MSEIRHRVWVYLALSAGVLGGISAYAWARLTTLPAYVVSSDGAAVIGQRGLTEIFTADATFAVFGFASGLVIGGVCWHNLRRIGWLVAVVATVTSLAGGLLCWWFGTMLGPNNFDERLALAQVNDPVVVDLNLHAYVALAAWPLGALIPVFLGGLFSPLVLRWRTGRSGVLPPEPEAGLLVDDEPVIDDQGVAKPSDAPNG